MSKGKEPHLHKFMSGTNPLDAVYSAPPAPQPAPADKKWAYTKQRDDLKRCPFCGTQAIEQGRLADNSTDMHFRISCGNPFCTLDCRTWIFASKENAEQAWQERETP